MADPNSKVEDEWYDLDEARAREKQVNPVRRILAPGIVPTGLKPYIKYIQGNEEWYVHGTESVWELPQGGFINRIEHLAVKGGSRRSRQSRQSRKRRPRRLRLKRKTSKR